MDSGFFPEQPKSNWDPRQLEIKYFWPLTEQIPLELDYTDCERPRYIYSDVRFDNGVTGIAFTSQPSTWSSTLSINAETVTFNQMKMPWYRKVLFKLMGFKWEK